MEENISTTIGIDLGTTNSLVGILQEGKPCLIPNSLGELLTPSAVGLDLTGQLLVGARARARKMLSAEDVVLSFKRDMGTFRTYELRGQSFRPEQLSALVLQSLKKDAEKFLGHAVDDCVISVPAYFGEAQRQATKTAAELAGLKVKRLINEPTAAALAFGLNNLQRETRAVVLDLGGGTFDVTVLQIMEGVVEVASSAGDVQLGGDDFDRVLADYACRRALLPLDQGGLGLDLRKEPLVMARVTEICQRLKHLLSTQDKATFRFETLSFDLTRAEALELWSDLRERLRRPIQQALKDAGLSPQNIDEVLLVGGSTRMPLVRELAQALFDCPVHSDLPPDEAVALGATVAAALFDDDAGELEVGLTDINPFSLGTSCQVSSPNGPVTIFKPIIPRGSVIPCSRIEYFSTSSDNQEQILIDAFQGEHVQPKLNTPIGNFMIEGLPPARAGELMVSIRFTYDLNGLLEIEATLEGTGKKYSKVFEKTPGKMTPAEIDQARREMARYKIAPEDEAPNKAALERAEALVATLSGRKRDQLTNYIAEFLAALAAQDPKIIEAARQKLNAHVLLLGSVDNLD